MKYTFFSRKLLLTLNLKVRIRLSLAHALSQVLFMCSVQEQLLERTTHVFMVCNFIYHCIVHEEGRVNNWV